MDKYSEFENDFLNADDSLLGITDDAVADKAHLYPIFQQISDRTERYRDFLFLGKGGEKSVSSAYDRIVERRIAMARPKVSDDMDCNEAFLREARITAFLDHPNIMPVHSIAIDDTGPYFTMECISGDSLSQLRARLCHHSLSVSVLFELLDVFERVCDAIAYAHSRGVLHLDLINKSTVFYLDIHMHTCCKNTYTSTNLGSRIYCLSVDPREPLEWLFVMIPKGLRISVPACSCLGVRYITYTESIHVHVHGSVFASEWIMGMNGCILVVGYANRPPTI